MTKSNTTLGQAERAVYELVERGAIDASHAALYRRPLLALARAGLVRRDANGGYAAIRAAGDTRPPPASEPVRAVAPPTPPTPPMQTLIVRVPPEVIDALDAIGPNRSEATRAVLGRLLGHGSGMRKAVRTG